MNKQQIKRKPLKKVYRLLYGKDDMKIVPESKVKNFEWYYVSEKGEKNESKHNGR
jgi:hypothetical protein